LAKCKPGWKITMPIPPPSRLADENSLPGFGARILFAQI
jgi:hypothetical protein